ncbi:hypothetical protein NE857_26825 [Nocardiopsis exhalans]|uniref:Uncharacterized protein n=1 Tax=Nocardiopsis exhalans TaxID=163604 RepID=A0ABY5D391_9ACTN|nr:hypothetical protein [Nocardiopsis exhalans]USY18857.1 hypothetical protein NE857_26825 [Nocardiopsis exhalans]
MSYEEHRDRLMTAFHAVAESDDVLHERISSVARLLARADDCAEQVENDGMMTRGSQGQYVAHPLLAEERNLRVQADRIWSECLPEAAAEDAADDSEMSVTSIRARQAARARWDRAKASGDR